LVVGRHARAGAGTFLAAGSNNAASEEVAIATNETGAAIGSPLPSRFSGRLRDGLAAQFGGMFDILSGRAPPRG
jgi:hypothetical protein